MVRTLAGDVMNSKLSSCGSTRTLAALRWPFMSDARYKRAPATTDDDEEETVAGSKASWNHCKTVFATVVLAATAAGHAATTVNGGDGVTRTCEGNAATTRSRDKGRSCRMRPHTAATSSSPRRWCNDKPSGWMITVCSSLLVVLLLVVVEVAPVLMPDVVPRTAPSWWGHGRMGVTFNEYSPTWLKL